MKLQAVSLIACLAVVFAAQAQPVLDQSDAPLPEHLLTYRQGNFVALGAVGADQVWDASGVADVSAPMTIMFISPQASGFGPQFPTATVATATGDNILFERADAGGRYVVGQYMVINPVQLIIPYSDEQLVMPYPCTFNTAFTDSFAYAYSVQGINATGRGQVDYVADGYGSLILPHGTVNDVLKLTGTYIGEETAATTTFRTEVQEVIFYKPGISGFVLRSQQIVQYNNGAPAGSGTVLQYLDNDNFVGLGASAAAEDGLKAWPVPASDMLRVEYKAPHGSRLQVTLTDAMGRNVRAVEVNAASATVAELDVKQLPRGLYLLQARDANGWRAVKQVVLE